jgi:predicted transcriptional regulator
VRRLQGWRADRYGIQITRTTTEASRSSLATVTQAQNPQGEKPMIKTEEVKQLHADGMEPGAIAKKLGVSPSAVTYHLRKNGASRKSLSPERRAKVVANSNGTHSVAAVIADLKAKRDKLTEAIEVLEAL